MNLRLLPLLLVSASALSAQTPPVGPAAEALAAYNRVKPNVIKAAEKMPEVDFRYKPTEDIRTFARIVNHVTEAQFNSCSTALGMKMDPKSVPSDTGSKAEVLAGLKASFELCDKAYSALTDTNVAEAIAGAHGSRSRITLAWGNISHDNEQYAELSTYLRLKGIAPPTSEK